MTLVQEEDDALDGDITAKNIYNKLTETDPDWDGYYVLSNKFVPQKVLFLFWASLHHSLPTRSMLQHRRVVVQSNLCLFCNTEVETLEHLFIRCSWASKI